MFNEFGEPVVGWYWMSDSGAGALGGSPEAGVTPGQAPGSPSPPAGDGVDTSPAGGEGVGEQGQEGVGQTPPASTPTPPAPREPDWRDKRIATLTRRLKEAQEKGPAASPPTPAPTGGYTQADVDRIAEQKARELAVIHDFNRRCDEVALMGRREFGDQAFNGQISNLQKIVDQDDPASVQSYNAFLMAAIDTGEAAKLLHRLGSDLDEAQRIMTLPPTRMAVELTKLAMGREPEVSGAPRPITPVGGRGATHELIAPDDPDRADHLGANEWFRRREAQVAERARARSQR